MNTGNSTINDVTLRPSRSEDATRLGAICYDAFRTISEEHNFLPDFPGVEAATGLITYMQANGGMYSVVAEVDGRIVGSNFLWEADQVGGIGPITVDPAVQNSAVGRALMIDVIKRADKGGKASLRLVQAAFHNRSLALYAKLGFDTVEPLSNIQGAALGLEVEGYTVRKMTGSDLPAVDALTFRVHGHTRHSEIEGAISGETARVVEHDGRITGYATLIGFFGHAVGESNEELKALIGEAEIFAGPGFLLPTRNSELLRWCLSHGLRITQPMTLMARGMYQEPRGAFLPSIMF